MLALAQSLHRLPCRRPHRNSDWIRINYSPLPFFRPMRGQYPITVALDFQRPDAFELFRSLSDGIPPLVGPDLEQGVIDVPATAGFRSALDGKLEHGYY